MEKFLHASFPEIVFGSSDPAQSQAIRRAVKAGKLHKIAPKIYSSNFKDSPASIIKKHRYQILGQRFSGGVISHRSALEGGVAKDGSIVITYKYTKKITLPGMVIRCVQGKGAQKGDMPFMTHLHLSSRARAFLENMQSGREGESLSKVLTRDKIEKRLIQIIRIHGEEELNHLRDQAKAIAPILKMKKEYQQLATLISAILGTHSHEQLTSTLAKAHATGKPYDPVRIELFADLVAALYAMQPIQRACHLKQAKAKANMAFFEAYFSNYIEGTEFEVNEAYQIVQSNQINIARPEDSHDILSTYAIVSNIKEMQTLPHTAAELIKLLKHRHAILMQARPHAMPGQFKDKINRAGNTVFVHPEEVVGTLERGFDIYETLEPGFQRAAFMMFMISETHPFLDGNGRMARIMMNAELVANQEWRIIIPTVYRNDYLLALRQLSRQHEPQTYLRMLVRAQAFTASINYAHYEKVVKQLTACHAFNEPNESKLIFRAK